MNENGKIIENTPQITNQAEMENALSGEKALYAVLNAPISGSPVDDPFGILTDEYFYIRYEGEIIKASVYYPEDMGPYTTYNWEQSGDDREKMSAQTFLYNNIPIDLTECIVNAPDGLSSDDQFSLPENSKAFINTEQNYFYPDGMGENPDDMEANCGLTRYKTYFLKSGTSISFPAWVGDNEISVYKSESDDDPYAIPTIIQHGDISEISWVLESGDVGGIILMWIGVIFIIISVSLASFYVSQQKEEAAEAAKTSDNSDKKKNKGKKKKRK
ncbi:MAG: hypothetical protein ACI4RG_07265 [Huintestinicola sp.]